MSKGHQWLKSHCPKCDPNVGELAQPNLTPQRRPLTRSVRAFCLGLERRGFGLKGNLGFYVGLYATTKVDWVTDVTGLTIAPMTTVATSHISTDDMPVRERVSSFREEFARSLLHVDLEPLGDNPFHAEATIRALPGVRILDCRASDIRMERTKALIPPDENMFGIAVMLEGHSRFTQWGREIIVRPGDAVVISHFDPAALTHSGGRHLGGVISLAAVAPLVADIETAFGRWIPRENEALKLLIKYLGILEEGPSLTAPELARSFATHVHDLIALVIGTTRDGADVAAGRGLRAARLRAVKADILANLSRPDLSVTAVAKRHGITPRYVHMLFEAEGTSFSQFILTQRLAAVHRILIDPDQDLQTISAIAYAAGFGDLSYFNHAFRRRYGATPREIRAEQMRPHEFGS
ncbi:helix-turn-helix transcriptional regulator [Sinorhizobium meliloti]|uniref:helix-turn-helix transcriptional regulator n=1 Tax=Rhizobium meliloti TaxID=382 RepID=UPI001AECC46D|nr:AraC family transcriptional regulator [Sinorhizobium meliloti]